MAVPSRVKYRVMASAVRRAANRYYKRNIKFYVEHNNRYYPDDKEGQKMIRDDRRDLREFAKLVNQGQIARAVKAIDRMDTAVYEEIPVRVYNYVNRFAQKQWEAKHL